MTDASFSPFETHLDQDRALAILRAALECHNGMATFGEAGVSDK